MNQKNNQQNNQSNQQNNQNQKNNQQQNQQNNDFQKMSTRTNRHKCQKPRHNTHRGANMIYEIDSRVKQNFLYINVFQRLS